MQDDTGNSSLWVAQRVPDDHVGSVTNGLSVREVGFGRNPIVTLEKQLLNMIRNLV
jgi:dipeptidase